MSELILLVVSVADSDVSITDSLRRVKELAALIRSVNHLQPTDPLPAFLIVCFFSGLLIICSFQPIPRIKVLFLAPPLQGQCVASL